MAGLEIQNLEHLEIVAQEMCKRAMEIQPQGLDEIEDPLVREVVEDSFRKTSEEIHNLAEVIEYLSLYLRELEQHMRPKGSFYSY